MTWVLQINSKIDFQLHPRENYQLQQKVIPAGENGKQDVSLFVAIEIFLCERYSSLQKIRENIEVNIFLKLKSYGFLE